MNTSKNKTAQLISILLYSNKLYQFMKPYDLFNMLKNVN